MNPSELLAQTVGRTCRNCPANDCEPAGTSSLTLTSSDLVDVVDGAITGVHDLVDRRESGQLLAVVDTLLAASCGVHGWASRYCNRRNGHRHH